MIRVFVHRTLIHSILYEIFLCLEHFVLKCDKAIFVLKEAKWTNFPDHLACQISIKDL